MFSKKQNEPLTSKLDEEIESILHQMKNTVDDEQYYKLLDRLERLYKIKLSHEPEKKSVSPDALVAAGASIGGIILILGFEKMNVITSKAMQFVFKPKP